MRGVAKDGPRNFGNDHKGLGQGTGVWKSQWAHVPGPHRVRAIRCGYAQLAHKAEPQPIRAS